MNALSSGNKDAQHRPGATTDKIASVRPLFLGLLTADFGLLLIALAEWDALGVRAHTLLNSGGGALCFVALVFIWTGTPRLGDSTRESRIRWNSLTKMGRSIY